MNLNEIPKIWFNVHKAIKDANPAHVMKVPGYVRLIVTYGIGETKWIQ